MDKTDHPTTFGVFKPTGHTVIALQTPGALQSTVIALKALGFMDTSMIRYTAAEMTALVDADLRAANPWLASAMSWICFMCMPIWPPKAAVF